MLSHRVLPVLLLSACAAAGSLGVDPQRSSPSSSAASLDLAAAPIAASAVPQVIAPRLPRADRIAHVIAARLGAEASVDVRFCVTPGGRIASATLDRGSSLPAFDAAVLDDLATWRFAPEPGADTTSACRLATIVYHPHP